MKPAAAYTQGRRGGQEEKIFGWISVVGSARYYGVGKEGGKRRGGAGTTDEDETNDGSMTIMNKVSRINYLKLSPNNLFVPQCSVTITKKRLLFPKKKVYLSP